MAHENTPPRTRIIILFTSMSVLTLAVLHPLFISYFTSMTVEELRVKIRERPATEVALYQREQAQLLERGELSIERSMGVIASGTRPPLVTPAPSNEQAPRAGWAFAPAYEAPPTPTPAPTVGGVPGEVPPEPSPGEEEPFEEGPVPEGAAPGERPPVDATPAPQPPQRGPAPPAGTVQPEARLPEPPNAPATPAEGAR